MKYVLSAAFLVASLAVAQTCIVPAPPTAPVPHKLIVELPPDGGTQGCTITSLVYNGAAPGSYAVSNAKCAQAVAMAKQAAANDNGWNDGGNP